MPESFYTHMQTNKSESNHLVMREGLHSLSFMQTDEREGSAAPSIAAQLHSVVDRMLEPFGKASPREPKRNALSNPDELPPIDIRKPNQHDTKAEFLVEFEAISVCFEHVDGLIAIFGGREDTPEMRAMLDRLKPIIDAKFRRIGTNRDLNNSIEMIRKNVADIGGFTASLFILLDLWITVSERKRELGEQQKLFWSLPHRAPDYYARIMSLRLARLFAHQTGNFPTVGTSGITGEPSTAFTRALKEVFNILNINSGTRVFAEWAVDQLTENDLRPPVPKGILGALMELAPSQVSNPAHDELARIVRAKSKGK